MSARGLLLGLLAVGVGLLAVGAGVFFAFFPHLETGGCFVYADFEGDVPCTVGNLRAALGGAAVAGVGFLVILVPIIASGVHLGRRLDGERSG